MCEGWREGGGNRGSPRKSSLLPRYPLTPGRTEPGTFFVGTEEAERHNTLPRPELRKTDVLLEKPHVQNNLELGVSDPDGK